MKIGCWYFSILPIFFILFLLLNIGDIHGTGNNEFFADLKKKIVKNIFAISYLFIILGILGILANLGIDFVKSIFYIMGINIVFLLGSFLIKNKNLQNIFYINYYFILGIIIFISINKFSLGLSSILDLLIKLISLTFGIHAFIIFVLGAFTEITNNVKSNFLFILNLFVISIIYSLTKENIYITVISSQVYLMLLYLFIIFMDNYEKKLDRRIKESNQKVNAQYILDGNKVLDFKQKEKNKFVTAIDHFFDLLDPRSRFLISFLNIIFIIIQIVLFYRNIGNGVNLIFYEISYWLGVIVFFINFILLKKINFYHGIQRFIAFFVINFGIYLSIMNIFGNNILYISILGASWSIFNSLLIFLGEKINKSNILKREDFLVWIITNMVASLINVYFIFRLEIDKTLKISIILLYIGIQLSLILYNFRYLKKIDIY